MTSFHGLCRGATICGQIYETFTKLLHSIDYWKVPHISANKYDDIYLSLLFFSL